MIHDLQAAAELIAGAVSDLEADVIELRRDLHRHPELSWQEHRTTDAIATFLTDRGLQPRSLPTETGLAVDIGSDAAGPGEGPVVLLRADIDALPLDDGKDVPYRSTVDGVCHACGHDVHTAVMAGAAVALHQSGVVDEGGRVRVLFQPAEEAIPGGASRLHDTWVTEEVCSVFAVHCDPGLNVGNVGVRAGPITSAADRVMIDLKGPGGHTARPHLTVDLVHAAAQVITDLPAELSRRTNPDDGATLVFGAVEAGRAPNVIPTEASLAGTLRVRGRETWDRAPELLDEILHGIVEPLGATAEMTYDRGSPPVENDAAATEAVSHAVVETLGADALAVAQQSVGSEDFSWLLEAAPGAYARLGVRTPGDDTARDLHASTFDVDERAIAIGSRVAALTALIALEAAS